MIQFTSLYLVPTLLLFPFLVIFWKSSKPKRPTSKLPPRPWKLPLIGNLHHLAGSLPHHSLRKLANKYGPVMRLQLGEIFAVVISSPEAARDVLQKHDLVFAQRPSTLVVEVFAQDHPGILFSHYGEYWRQIRKICVLELLSAQRVQLFRSIREEEVWNLIESIYSSYGHPINLREMFGSLTNAVTSRAAFGKKCRGQEEFISSMKELIPIISGFDVADLFPSVKFLGVMTGMKATAQRVRKKFDEILDDIISEHKMKIKYTKRRTDEPNEEDLVDLLLKLQQSSELKFEITTGHIKNVILDVFSAGSETAATTLEWAMAELLRNPRVAQKAQAEVRQVVGGKRRVDETDIHKLIYLKSVVQETLRLHPPVPLLPRESTQRCEILGYEIPYKAKVIINVWALGRDPEIWSNADCFQPERFIGSSIVFKGTNFEFLPFGAGRRMCPGISFACANVELLLAQLLYQFEWKLPNGGKLEELDMIETYGGTSKMKNDLYAIAIPFAPAAIQ